MQLLIGDNSILLEGGKLALQLEETLVEVLIRCSRLALASRCRASVIGCAEGLRGGADLRGKAALTCPRGHRV